MSQKVIDICEYMRVHSMVTDGMITSVSASKLSGTLPAVSGANLTDLPAANITGALPAIDGSALTGISASGISNLAEDTTPQLGGTLDFNSQKFTGSILPDADNTYDIGSAAFKIRDMYVSDSTIHMGDEATIKAEGKAIVVQDLKTGDLHLDNTQRDGNSVDGTNGSWTFQEGAEDMYLLNNVSGKKYRINLTEI